MRAFDYHDGLLIRSASAGRAVARITSLSGDTLLMLARQHMRGVAMSMLRYADVAQSGRGVDIVSGEVIARCYARATLRYQLRYPAQGAVRHARLSLAHDVYDMSRALIRALCKEACASAARVSVT